MGGYYERRYMGNVGFGWFLGVLGNFSGGGASSVVLWLISLALIGGGPFLGLRPGGILRKESTIDTWGALLDEACVDDGQERADTMYREITQQLRESCGNQQIF
jgi:hypothetical protein